MQQTLTLIFKALRLLCFKIRFAWDNVYTRFLFYTNNVAFKTVSSNGIPFVMIARGGKCEIEENFKINNGLSGNPIGRPQPCVFFVDKNASLKIGNNVGMSSTAIVAHTSISIGNYVKIGGGTCIYDTDFHSLEAIYRRDPALDLLEKKKSPVKIGDNVFIGAHSTILKGVEIGENAIIGACSVVTKSVPANEIWAGNPAKFIKKIDNQ